MNLQSKYQPKTIVITILIVLLIIIVVFSFIFRGDRHVDNYKRLERGTFSPLEKSTIGKTTDKEISQRNDILNKKIEGDVTMYETRSQEPGKTDSIRTENGVVIFEETATKTNAASLPKISLIISAYGEPEEKIDNIGEGFYLSAYLYPTKGFVAYANRYTDSVYKIQRFVPMSLAEYKRLYGESLSPAHPMPQEGQGTP